ncbi:WD40 repeat-like protein [Auriscalpium vulgare]|uniref:WD40 repeat-like protein n=1 Tax=Auriscalpium vulgare TaxID=40419 RepID=A0ACB8RCN3_9AGAM|nr:WD40 repeat-like protein [Auriscalpium vulgare]
MRSQFPKARAKRTDASSSRPLNSPIPPVHADIPPTHASPTAEKRREGDGIAPSGAGKATPRTQAKGQSCKCTQPPNGQHGRNLVVCIDGTANQFSKNNTNVVELYSRLEKDVDQLTYYDSGIGTYVRDSKWSPSYWKQAASHTIDMAIAWNFKRIVLSAYQWLSENYQEGDKIFLFGFSRGAYQVRVIAGIIEKVGLLHKGNNNQIPFAYELYVSTTSNRKRADARTAARSRTGKGNDTKTTKEQEELCSRFKLTLSRPHARVHFVGVWDTVSSVGVARGPSLPETTTGMTHVCVFRHALALDERRCKFLPEYANGGNGPPLGDDVMGDVKEVWFVGSHSDIGGGNIPNLELDHFGAALRWMSYEAIMQGLRMSSQRGEWRSFPPNPSLSWVWKFIEILPLRRLSYKDGNHTTRRPHLGQPRQVKEGQLIHESVFEDMLHGNFKPTARLPDRLVWDRDVLVNRQMLEGDVYASAAVTLSQVKAATAEEKALHPAHQNALTTLACSVSGRDSIATTPDAGNILMQALLLEHSKGNAGSEQRSLNIAALAAAIAAVPSRPPVSKGFTESRLLELVSVLAGSPEDVKAFMNTFRKVRLFRGHKYDVNSVAFSPDGKRIISSSDDGTIRIWDVQTGETVAGPFSQDTYFLISARFSPDGKHVVSGSANGPVTILDAQTGKTVAERLKGHTDMVFSVTFSPDGRRVVSGSFDNTIRIWDAQTAKTVVGPLEGHTDWIRCVAISPDGERVVSGSNDRTVRVWDSRAGEMAAGPFTGHTESVLSVAFSPDGERIVSGSSDRTIWVLHAQTGETVAGPFTGHNDWVTSVAFSPDGKRVVSGSVDAMIRIWDAQTGETVVGPLTGHANAVWSVAYSPGGTLVASGSTDGTVRLWDAE